jgi:uncharacterized phiE125 gp8 family phage protein
MMDVRVVSRSTKEAVSLDRLKVHCRVRGSHDDDLLRTMLSAAVLQFEEHTSRKVLTTTLELQLCEFPCDNTPIELPHPPFVSLDSINYLDSNDDPQTLTGTRTRTGAIFTTLYPERDTEWPEVSDRANGDEVTIDITCGYGEDHNAVPNDLQVSLMALVSLWYEDREVGDVPQSIKNLWGPYVTEPII